MASFANVDFKCFSLLLKASSKKQVLDLLREAHAITINKNNFEAVVKTTAATFSVTNREASELVTSLSNLIKAILYENLTTSEAMSEVFPSDMHPNLKDLLIRILVECVPDWRLEVISNLVSIPKLIDFNWRVDVKMASDDDDKRSNVPSCVLQLKIEDRKKMQSEELKTKTVNVELSKETLDTMLHGLGRIRDQLTAVANKS